MKAKRTVAMLFCLLVLVCLFPASAFAEAEGTASESVQDLGGVIEAGANMVPNATVGKVQSDALPHRGDANMVPNATVGKDTGDTANGGVANGSVKNGKESGLAEANPTDGTDEEGPKTRFVVPDATVGEDTGDTAIDSASGGVANGSVKNGKESGLVEANPTDGTDEEGPKTRFVENVGDENDAEDGSDATTTYAITVSADPSVGGTVSGGGDYAKGDSVTVTATANENYIFVEWSEDGEQVSTNASYTFTAAADRALVAIFDVLDYEVSEGVGGSSGGGVLPLSGDVLDGATIRLRPQGSYKQLTIEDNGTILDENVHLYDIGATSRFELTKAGRASYYISYYESYYATEPHTKKFYYLVVAGSSKKTLTRVRVNSSTSATDHDTSRQWRFYQLEDGSYLIQNVHSDLYMALYSLDNINTNKNRVVQRGTQMRWEIEFVRGPKRSDGTRDDLKEYDSYSFEYGDDGGSALVTSADWMSHLPDYAYLTDLSIPGVHDAGTAKVGGFTDTTLTQEVNPWRCQQLYIDDLLTNGVRYFDLRLSQRDSDGMVVVRHGDLAEGLSVCKDRDGNDLTVNTVMDWVNAFLEKHPGETVILAIKDEAGNYNSSMAIYNYFDHYRLYHDNIYTGYGNPQLADVRGKIVLITRIDEYEGGRTYHIDPRDPSSPAWAIYVDWCQGENYAPKLASFTNDYEFWTQDKYHIMPNEKWKWIEGSLLSDEATGAKGRHDHAVSQGKGAWVVSFTSTERVFASGNLVPLDCARDINKWLKQTSKLGTEANEYVGIVCVDFMDEQMAQRIYAINFRVDLDRRGYYVRFDANVPANASTACSGAMDDQAFAYDERKALDGNAYSLPGYDFDGWNTKADGTGTSYGDKAEVQDLSDSGGAVTLYAKWSPKPYTITYYESDDAGSQTHTQIATFDQPGKLDKVSTFNWNTGGKTLHGWSRPGLGLGSFYEDGEDFCNLCGEPDADGNLADAVLTADWVQNGQIVVTVTKDGVPQGGLSDHLKLVQGTTEFTVPISDENVSGRYVFDPAGATIGGQPAQLPEGNYKLQFSAEGYPSASAEITYGENRAVSVVFDYYTISLTKDPTYADFNEVEISGGVPVEGVPGTVVALDGDTLRIKTTVEPGYSFACYIAAGVAPVWEYGDITKAEQAVEVQGSVDIMARVEPIPYSVIVEGGTADKATATVGETVTITADAPKSGEAFVQWALVDGVVFANASSGKTTFTMPAKDVTVTAVTAPIVIEAIGDKVYTGSAIEPTDEVRVSLDGVDLQLTADDYEVSFADNVNAGDAKVIVTMKSLRAGSATSTFKIAPKPATIKVNDASKVQGEDDPAFTGTVKGLVNAGDLGAVTYKRTNDDEAPGTFGGVLTAEYVANPNYNVSVTDGDFTIKKRFTVRWLDGDGSVLQSKYYGEGDEPPTYDGKEPMKTATAQYTYGFIGWDDGTVEGATTTYRPLFSETVNKYKVTFVDYDGTTVLKEAAEYDYGTPAADIVRPADPTRKSDAQYTYTFSGWTPEVVTVTGDATYTAAYDEVPVVATLTFDLGGGALDGKTGTIIVEANVGDVIKLPGVPTREGYTFKYWKGSKYEAGADYEVKGDHAFTAEWEKNEPATAQGKADTKPAVPSTCMNASQCMWRGKADTKPAIPLTGDDMGMAIIALAVAAIGSLLVLAACALRRKSCRGHRSR